MPGEFGVDIAATIFMWLLIGVVISLPLLFVIWLVRAIMRLRAEVREVDRKVDRLVSRSEGTAGVDEDTLERGPGGAV